MDRHTGCRSGWAWIVGSILLISPLHAEDSEDQPAETQDAEATLSDGGFESARNARPTQPLDKQTEQILDRLEAKGNEIKTLEAELDYVKVDPILEDRTVNSGVLRFKEDEPNPNFFIRFDTRTVNKRRRKEKEWHIFDGRWYWEVREKLRQINKREIVAPGEKTDVFSVGKGQFPMPFGQKKDEILKYFDVQRVKAINDAPARFKGEQLKLIPKPGTAMARDFSDLDFYIDEKSGLPVRVRTTERKQGNELEITFSNVKINPKFDKNAMELPREVKEYTLIQEPLPKRSGSTQPRSSQ